MVQWRVARDHSAGEHNCDISLFVPSENFTCSQALVIWQVLTAYVIFGRSANYSKTLNQNLFSFENPLLSSVYVRWRHTGRTASFSLCEYSISLYLIRNWDIFRTELIILNIEERKGSLGGSLCCFFPISETGHFNSSSEHKAKTIFNPGSLLSIPCERVRKKLNRTFDRIYTDTFLKCCLKKTISFSKVYVTRGWLVVFHSCNGFSKLPNCFVYGWQSI